MSTDIKNIFENNKKLLLVMDKVVHYFRTQNYDKALRSTTYVIDTMNSYLESLIVHADYFNQEQIMIDPQGFMNMLSGILDAQQQRDYVLLADLYEIQLLPFFNGLQEYIIGHEEFDFSFEHYQSSLEQIKRHHSSLDVMAKKTSFPENGDIAAEFTSSGFVTLAADEQGKKYYLHSNRTPSSEAFHLASSWYKEGKETYIVYGLGLAYHIQELAELDEGIKIEVYEGKADIIHMACAYSDLRYILQNPAVTLIYDPDYSMLMKRIANLSREEEFVIHYPSLRLVTDRTARERLEDYFIQYSSIKNQKHILDNNFKSNIKLGDASIDVLKNEFTGKDLYIVAAGPSLDRNFQLLKELNGRGIILATGTVFRKLIKAGITPDYVIVTDANNRVYRQVRGLENSPTAMLYLSTANKQFAHNYKGRKYIICQAGYRPAEEYAEEKGYQLYQTGGSVSTTALDIGISFRCARIIFLGLDLAYTDNAAHALDTSRRELPGTDDLIKVVDIHGNDVYTTKVLNIYRKWIENRIRNVKGIQFIDATEGGARIQGMRIAKLSDLI